MQRSTWHQWTSSPRRRLSSTLRRACLGFRFPARHCSPLTVLASMLLTLLVFSIQGARANDRQAIITLRFVPAANSLQQALEGTVPELEVFADGTVHARSNDGGRVTVQWQRREVEILLKELLVECQLGGLDSRAIQAEVQAEGVRRGISTWIAGAEDTLITIQVPAQTVQLRCHAVGLMSARFPQVQPLQQVLLAQERLQNLRALVLLGDGAIARRLADRASESLQAQLPGCSPLTPRELTMVHTLPDGTRLVQFCRRPDRALADDSPLLIVSVIDVPGEAPRVTVMSGDRVVR